MHRLWGRSRDPTLASPSPQQQNDDEDDNIDGDNNDNVDNADAPAAKSTKDDVKGDDGDAVDDTGELPGFLTMADTDKAAKANVKKAAKQPSVTEEED